ncbi:FtsK/SpoIIIE domain-containing protein [Zafaria sp. Z1313]|uniref:FtsK/SpoIIIE domain-containing protein n=1 Tax=unclassified Zafaria TaxID=2828765 RepID=UPI002E791A19|nr:FtsK/SpoIIIE domain-containing protein [Zafaria sp. J156]MEE1622166.1 FtsK/SpoIIIE domain-containing protein [Zafaria sp. J156]
MTLHLTVSVAVDAGLETRRFEVPGPGLPTGAELGAALEQAGCAAPHYVDADPLPALGPLPRHGHLHVTPFPRTSPGTEGPPPVWLVVDSGPDAGQARPLARGTHTLGRGDVDARVLDPALSREHARIVVDGTSVTLRPSTSGERRLGVGDRFTLGGTAFRLDAAPRSGPVSGRLPEPVDPGPPPGPSRPWLMLVGALLPLLVGVVLAVTLGTWIFLAFCAIGLFTGGIPAVLELRARRRRGRSLGAASADYVRRLDGAAPGLGSLALAAASGRVAPGDGGGPAVLRLGSGGIDVPFRDRGTEPDPARTARTHRAEGPVVVGLRPGGVGVVSGRGTTAASAFRALVAQLAVRAAGGGPLVYLAGDLPELPVQLRRVRNVFCIAAPEDFPASGVRRPATIVAAGDAAAWQEAVPGPGESGPAFLLHGFPGSTVPDWHLEATAARWRGDDVAGRSGGGTLDVDGMSFDSLARLAEDLADDTGAADHGGSGPLPRHVALEEPARAWTGSCGSSLLVQLGATGSGPLVLDLVADGPHALVAGTTGSGKSELVRSVVTSLAMRYGPDELAFLLVDFKGGATLGPFASLPHTQAIVTDLSAATAERTLESLGVELKRRESLLQRAGAPDYATYRSTAGPEGEALPRLAVVVDEFRIMTDELPGALPELLRIAAVGRSLGVHLLLATQRPQGVVSADLRANINAVVCLRLLSAFDSNDLLGSAAAAAIDRRLPGRAYLRRGTEDAVEFQAAHAGGTQSRWSLLPLPPTVGRTPAPLRFDSPRTHEEQPVERLSRLGSGHVRPRPVARVFAPGLPAALSSVPRRFRQDAPAGSVPLGLLDDVPGQRLRAWCWDPSRERRLAATGGPDGGIAGLARQLVQGAARREPECHVYVLDGAGFVPEAPLLPRVAGVVTPRDAERMEDVLALVESATDSGAERVLVVTGLAAWAAALGGAGFASFDDRLAALARSAESLGLALAVLGDRDLTSSRYFSLAEHRVYCPLGLGPETVLGWPRLRPVDAVRGRGVLTGPGRPESGTALQLIGADRDAGHAAVPAPEPGLPPARSLPLPTAAVRHPTAGGTVDAFAVTGPDNRPWVWDPGPVGLLLGGSGSGKSTALRSLAQLLPGRPAVLSPASGWPDPDAPETPAAGPRWVLVDDATDITPGQRAVLEGWRAAGARIVMAAEPSSRLFTELPLAQAARAPGSVILLDPRHASDGDFAGWRAPVLRERIPGRAAAWIDGRLRWIQCLLPDDGPARADYAERAS